MPTVNEQILDRVIARAFDLERLKKAEIERVLAKLRKSTYPALLREAGKLAADAAGVGARPSTTRQLDLARRLREIVERGARDAFETLSADVTTLAASEAQWATALVTETVPFAVTIEGGVTAAYVENVTRAPLRAASGSMRQWFDQTFSRLSDGTFSAIREGVASGQSVPEMVRAVESVAKKSRNEIRTIVRTTVNSASNQTREATFAAVNDLARIPDAGGGAPPGSPLVKRVQWLSTLDTKTSLICLSLDGQTWQVGEGPRPPAHPNCRSVTVPVLASLKELGIDLPELPAGTRATMDGQIPETVDAQQWLKGQTKDRQLALLGPKRTELFRAGKVKLTDLVRKGDLQPLTIADLEAEFGKVDLPTKRLPKPKPTKLPRVKSTEELYKVGGEWTAARAKLHDEIVEDILSTGRQQNAPVYQMMGGGPASGKSALIRSGSVKLPKANVFIDSDEIKKRLPEFVKMTKAGNPSAASVAHEESSYLSKLAMRRSAERRFNTTLDGTGDGSIEGLRKKVATMRDRGFRVKADYVTVDTEVAVQRNLDRFNRTGRMVPEKYVRNVHASISDIVPQAIDEGLFDEFALWDTNAVPGVQHPIRLVARYQNGRLKIHEPELWQRFLAKSGDRVP